MASVSDSRYDTARKQARRATYTLIPRSLGCCEKPDASSRSSCLRMTAEGM